MASELADFEPSTGHRHDCRRRDVHGHQCDCALQLYELATARPSEPPHVPFHIDGLLYVVPPGEYVGHDIRRFAHPPIGDDRVLWLQRLTSPDVEIGDVSPPVPIAEGVELYTTPRAINAG